MDVQLEHRRYVLFHRDCIDGAAAQYAAWKKFGFHCTYIGVQYNEPLPKMDDGSEVYILDFSYSRKILVELEKRMRQLVVLDHHKTAARELEGLPWAHFDMHKSGAVLAWEYFHPEEPIPQVILHVQDRDLWKWKLPDTDVITAGLLPVYRKMDGWDNMTSSEDGEYFMSRLKKNGRVILQYQDHLIEEIARDGKRMELWGVQAVIVNSIGLMRSELAQKLLDLYPGADLAIIAIAEGTSVKLSFRSREKDIEWIALNLGGGGHGTACSAYVDHDLFQEIYNNEHAEPTEFPWWAKLLMRLKRKFLG